MESIHTGLLGCETYFSYSAQSKKEYQDLFFITAKQECTKQQCFFKFLTLAKQCTLMAPVLIFLTVSLTHDSECKVRRQEDILFSCNRAASCCNRKTRDGCSQGNILERLQETWLFVWQGNYIPFLISFLHCFQYLIIYCWKFSNCHGLYVVRLVVWSPYLIEIAIVLDINIASKIQLWKLLLRNILIQAAPSHILKVVSFNDKSTDPPSPPPKKKDWSRFFVCAHVFRDAHPR